MHFMAGVFFKVKNVDFSHPFLERLLLHKKGGLPPLDVASQHFKESFLAIEIFF